MVRRWMPAVIPALVLGGLWWWAVLRLVLVPGESGPLEGTVVIGGWGLSLLPVHVVALPAGRSRTRRRAGASSAGVWGNGPAVECSGGVPGSGPAVGRSGGVPQGGSRMWRHSGVAWARAVVRLVTRASRRRR
ncbi:hypothetical protein [Streptomyces sp. SID10853]|uniref:hypothetical protein n=1 Tax=Streptomyces sp. SID10853 TaxID=2706028 RepID=UPI001EF1ABB0|nr:hypothetical protein [Streptomyces sp. SID10853]